MTTFAEVKRIGSISARRQFASTEPFCELSVAFSRRRDHQSGPGQGRKSESFASFDGISLVLINDVHETPVLHFETKPFSVNVKDWSSQVGLYLSL